MANKFPCDVSNVFIKLQVPWWLRWKENHYYWSGWAEMMQFITKILVRTVLWMILRILILPLLVTRKRSESIHTASLHFNCHFSFQVHLSEMNYNFLHRHQFINQPSYVRALTVIYLQTRNCLSGIFPRPPHNFSVIIDSPILMNIYCASGSTLACSHHISYACLKLIIFHVRALRSR